MHKARKRFGQNFLQDQALIERIINAIAPKEGDFMVEIGPGQGALTEHLLARLPRLKAVELDRDLVPALRVQFFNYSEFEVIEADAMKTDFSQFNPGAQIRIVGNLPYNISTPLIFHLLSHHQTVQDMHFMLQKEVVERLCAQPGSGQYGRLSVMAQYHCQNDFLFLVPPTAFHPQPKVDSAIIRMTPKAPELIAESYDDFSLIVREGFAQRRKTLRNNLKKRIKIETVEAIGIDPARRPETLTVVEWVKIANAYHQQKNDEAEG